MFYPSSDQRQIANGDLHIATDAYGTACTAGSHMQSYTSSMRESLLCTVDGALCRKTLIVAVAGALAACAFADGVKVSEKFGYDKDDSTRFIQAALDSDEPEIVLDQQTGPWFATPLMCRKTKTIRFEDGAWIVAKRGEFKGVGDTLITLDACRGVKILGTGPDRCGFRMWRDDYMTTNLYEQSEHRMGITLRSCEDVLIEGVASNESGGDGLYIANRGRNSEPCRNVTVRNCVFDRNCRQGVSVISVDGLLMENVVMSNTRGRPPQGGIDFEPNANKEMLSRIVMRNCRAEGNAGGGFGFSPNFLDSHSRKVTALFENCVSIGNARSAFGYSCAFRKRRPGVDSEIPYDEYDIVLKNCLFENSGTRAISLYTKPYARGRFVFENCRIVNCGKDEPDSPDFAVSVTGHEGYEPNSIEFRNVEIVQPKKRPWLEMYEPAEKPFKGEPTWLDGVVKVSAEGSTVTHRLDDAWRAANTPFTPCEKRTAVLRVAAPLTDVAIVDAKPGEAVPLAPVFVRMTRLRQTMFYVFRAEKGRTVDMTAYVEAWGKEKVKGSVVVTAFGAEQGKVWSKSLKGGKMALKFDVPETGFYAMGLKTKSATFGIISSNVPVALDATDGQVALIGMRRPYAGYAGGKLFFWIPGGTPAVTASYWGTGREALAASIFRPDGAIAFEYPERLGLRYARFDAPTEGLWSIALKPPRKFGSELHRISLNGVPGWLFLSAEKFWKTERK